MLKKLKQKQIYSDNWLEFYQDEIQFPDGTEGTYAYAKRKDGVAVVVISNQGKILLQKEHRYVINEFSWEIQGGGIDEDESVAEAAVRELSEEAGIGIDIDSLIILGSFYPSNSFNTEKVSLFMVVIDGEEIHENSTEQGEHLEERQFFTFDEVYMMIDTGKINDALTANAVQLAMRKFKGLCKNSNA